MADNGGIVVLGAGQAAVQLAMTLRQKKYTGAITLIGNEPYPPYSRPPLSKSFLKGDTETEDLFFRQPEWFHEQDVTLRLGMTAKSVDLNSKTVRIADGNVEFDKLIFATGTRPRILPSLSPETENVVYLRGIDDVQKTMARIPNCRSAAVIGGGFIGLEFAAVMRGMGREVTVIEAGPRLMGRAVSPAISDWFLDLHRDRGVDVRLKTQIAEVRSDGNRVTELALNDGSDIAIDIVVVGIGVLPNDDLAREAGLDTKNGITVDEMLQTSHPDVYAIEDCCNFPTLDSRNVRLESVQNAVDQAKQLAATLTGAPAPYQTVPWFWSDQFDAKLQIAGILPTESTSSGLSDTDTGCSIDHMVDGHLACRETVNDPRAHLAARKELKTALTPA